MRWIIDSGSGFDLISGQSLTKDDRRMITKTDNPCRMATANGITTADEQLSVHVNGINSAVDAVILDNSPCNVLSLGKLCMEKGFGFEWKPGEPPKLLLPNGTVRVLMVDQYVPVLASALAPEGIEEANLQDKAAPPDAGGKESTSSAEGNPSTRAAATSSAGGNPSARAEMTSSAGGNPSTQGVLQSNPSEQSKKTPPAGAEATPRKNNPVQIPPRIRQHNTT